MAARGVGLATSMTSMTKMKNDYPITRFFLNICLWGGMATGAMGKEPPKTAPDLTQASGAEVVDRNSTYNLGSTGMRGWIYTRPASYLDSIQGRTTAASRQIFVTHVGVKSPADGVMAVGDVILGVGGKPFAEDARKAMGKAIQESEVGSGGLRLTRWREGKTEEVKIPLRAMGAYSATAPFDCGKSKKIFEEACKVLEKENLNDNLWGAISGLALLSTGKAEYLPKLQAFARKIGPKDLKLELRDGMVVWDWGYRNLFLCEYFLATGDQEVSHAINEYTTILSKGQGMYGTFGHGIAPPSAEGKLHGSIPPYGPVNEAGLIGNLSIVMGKKCGVKDPEVEAAVVRASGFFGYYVDKGGIPYGEHEPWMYHENNGKSSMTAVFFAVQGNRVKEAQFFAKMATAGYANREIGHTGQGFSYLWGALGANVGGPMALAAFFKEASWHFDLVRRSDGSFTYDGGEQYGAGKTDDNTYYGRSSYNGLSPAATYVLTYAIPLKNLVITGKGANPANWLTRNEVGEAIASGRFDVERSKKSVAELLVSFGDWSPVVRGWAAEEVAKRPEAASMVGDLLAMAEGKDNHLRQAACEALGEMRSAAALPALVRQLSAEDRWVRFKAAQALKKMGGAAEPALADILRAVAATAEPLVPINWADPIQLAQGQLAAALFSGGLTDKVKGADAKLLYPAVRAISLNADGMARATLRGFFDGKLSEADIDGLAPDILLAIQTRGPADTMFGNEIRMGGFKALTKYHYKEAIAAGVQFAKTQGGHGSESRTGEIMKQIVGYGAAAKEAIPGLKELIVTLNDQVARKEYPGGELNQRRVGAVEEAIKAIEASKEQPVMKTVGKRTP